MCELRLSNYCMIITARLFHKYLMLHELNAQPPTPHRSSLSGLLYSTAAHYDGARLVSPRMLSLRCHYEAFGKKTRGLVFISCINGPIDETTSQIPPEAAKKMEAISSITSLLSTILQGFQYIQLARAFDDDFKLYQTRLGVIQLRLSRWGQAAGFAPLQQSEASSENEISQSSSPALTINADLGSIEDMLDTLSSVLKKAQKESEKWKPKGVESECSPASEDDDLTPSRFKRLNMQMRGIIERRYQKATTQVESLKWALYKREQCESVTTQLSELIGQLELFVEPQSKLEELTQEDSKAIGESLKTFLEVVGKCDPRLEEAAQRQLEDKEELTNISISATNNHGLQLGVNRGEMKGLSFGTGNTTTNNWK